MLVGVGLVSLLVGIGIGYWLGSPSVPPTPRGNLRDAARQAEREGRR